MDRADVSVMADALLESERGMTWLEGRGLELATVVEASLGYVAEGRYGDCIAIPYFDAKGRWRTTRYRHLRQGAPMKYQTPKGEGRHLYNVAAVDEPVVAVCEGEFDSLVLTQMGIPAVAIPGATTWQREWRWLFRNSDLVLVITDADEAGATAGAKIQAQIGQVTSAERVELPDGMDVTDLYLSDPDHLRRLLA